MKQYQIWRHPRNLVSSEIAVYENEGRDIFVGYRLNKQVAEQWIESQKDQVIKPSDYFIKEVLL